MHESEAELTPTSYEFDLDLANPDVVHKVTSLHLEPSSSPPADCQRSALGATPFPTERTRHFAFAGPPKVPAD